MTMLYGQLTAGHTFHLNALFNAFPQSWSFELERAAKTWLTKCSLEKGSPSELSVNVGQNWFWSYIPKVDVTKVMQVWFDDIANAYDPANHRCIKDAGVCQPYLQVSDNRHCLDTTDLCKF